MFGVNHLSRLLRLDSHVDLLVNLTDFLVFFLQVLVMVLNVLPDSHYEVQELLWFELYYSLGLLIACAYGVLLFIIIYDVLDYFICSLRDSR